MKTFKDDNELIHAFLQNELSEKQRKEVEQRINSDKDFALEVEVAQVADEAIVHHRLFDVKASLGAIMANDQSPAQPRKKWRLWLLGLSVIAGIFTVWLTIDSSTTKNSQNIIKPPIWNTTSPIPETNTILDKETRNVKKKTIFTSSKKVSKLPRRKIESSEISIQAKLSETDSLDIIEDEPLDTLIDTGTNQDSWTIEDSVASIDCDQVIITADVLSEGTCPTDQNGKVTIIATSIEGGEAPYSFSLNELGNYNPTGTFGNLEIGYHEVYIKDNHGCVVVEDVYIEELPCNEGAIFAPDEGESWNIPNPNGLTGTLILYNRTGSIVQKINISGDLNQSWDGYSMSGSIVPMGEYSYQIKYSNGQIEMGAVTVVR